MIKANVNNGKVEVTLDGVGIDIMADLCMLNDAIITELEKKSGVPAEEFLKLITGAIKARLKEEKDTKEKIQSDSISKDIFKDNDIR